MQFTPDLVPSDLVGTRIYRADAGKFDTELGPVFCNFLLADEINRAPAKVQSALLEVMQEHQVTIGQTTYPVPDPFLVMATQNPIESEGTYPLPEAQIDRFMLKILVGYPEHDEELTVVQRSLVPPPELRQALTLEDLAGAAARRARGLRRPGGRSYSVTLADGDARPRPTHGLAELARTSPSAPARAARSASCRAPARSRSCAGRDYVVAEDRRRRSRRTRCATASCSATRRSRRRSRPTGSSTRCSALVPLPQIDLGRASAA